MSHDQSWFGLVACNSGAAERDRYERLCALQKKVSELFGIPLETESETKP